MIAYAIPTSAVASQVRVGRKAFFGVEGYSGTRPRIVKRTSAQGAKLAYLRAAAREEPAVEYVERRLAEISETANERAIEMVKIITVAVTEENSIYPSVSPDGDGGIIVYWKALYLSIEVDVDADLTFYVRIRNSRTGVVQKWAGASFPFAALSRALKDLTNLVERQNPGWRKKYA